MHNVGKWLLFVRCELRRSRSACASVQSDLGSLCSLTYTAVSIDSLSRQRRPSSATLLRRLIWASVVRKLHQVPFSDSDWRTCVLNAVYFLFLLKQRHPDHYNKSVNINNHNDMIWIHSYNCDLFLLCFSNGIISFYTFVDILSRHFAILSDMCVVNL